MTRWGTEAVETDGAGRAPLRAHREAGQVPTTMQTSPGRASAPAPSRAFQKQACSGLLPPEARSLRSLRGAGRCVGDINI